MKKPKVFNARKGNNPKTFKAVAMRSERILSLWEMQDGLCSKYYRHLTDKDEDPPEKISLDVMWSTIRDEYDKHGDNNVWTWSESYPVNKADAARLWARQVVLANIPELRREL